MRSILSAAALVLVCGGLQAAEPDKKAVDAEKKAAVKKAAEAVGEATRKGDVPAVVDGTYDPVIAEGGGREKTIELLRQFMAVIKIVEYQVGDPGEFHTGGKLKFVVVPTSMVIEVQGMKLKGNSYLLGISTDDGTTWKFVDGAGLGDEEVRKKLLPDLPATLKLPKPEEPKIVN